jgi:hypothetical protein
MVRLIFTLFITCGLLSQALAKASGPALSDKALMEKARSRYAKGELEKAIGIYTQIPVSSDFWLEALEERSWAALRQGNYEKALADLQSITSAVWSSQVGPETYMLSTFVSLKICAYKDVVKKIDLFKQRMLPRVKALQAIIDQPLPEEFFAMSEDLKAGRISMASLGQKAETYPRFFYRDHALLSALETKNNLRVQARMKVLADQDLKEIETNLKKMKIIEVELIQNVLLAEDLKRSKAKDLKFAQIDRNRQLVFPVTDDEVWVDEVGNFEVRAQNCPLRKASSL